MKLKRKISMLLVVSIMIVQSILPVSAEETMPADISDAINLPENSYISVENIDIDNLDENTLLPPVSKTRAEVNEINWNSIYSASLPSTSHAVAVGVRVTRAGLYAFETHSSGTNVNTRVVVADTAGNMIGQDYNSGPANFSSLGLKLNPGAYVFYVFLNGNSTSGSFYFQARYQRAATFTFNYPDGLDVRADAVQPSLHLTSTGYYVQNYVNDIDINSADISKIYPKLNTEILFWSGHGAPGYLALCDNSTTKKYLIYGNSINNLTNTKLAVFATCNSAKSGNGSVSVMDGAVSGGAKCAVGFTDVTGDISSRTFTNALFDVLKNGVGVEYGCSHALAKTPNASAWGIDSYKIAGTKTTTITSPATNVKKSSIIDINTKKAIFEQKLQEDEYAEQVLTAEQTRFYKLINNIKTNEYIDVVKDSAGEIVEIFFPEEVISSSDIPESAKSRSSYSFDAQAYAKTYENENVHLRDIREDEPMYYNVDGEVQLLKCYVFELENTFFESVYLEGIYVNQLDGSIVQPEKIMPE